VDSEFKAYILMIVAATVICSATMYVHGASDGEGSTVRDALFQSVSIATTTGYITADYDLWPAAAQLVLLLLMVVGGMAGSTSGGIKVIRIVVFFRHAVSAMKRELHPRAIIPTRVSGKAIRDDDLMSILAFILLFMLLFILGIAAMTFLGHDLMTSIGASAASIGNVGPGLGAVGATDNYGWMGPASQLVLAFLMLVGRLEIFTVLLLFHRDLWRRDMAQAATTTAMGEVPVSKTRPAVIDRPAIRT
jgi:trk system potassium uptake protein TrkH